MLRFVRIALAIIGAVLVSATCALTWVDVEIDADAIGDASETVVDEVAGEDSQASDLVDGARDTVERVEGVIPDRLRDATFNGLNAYELIGIGFVIAGMALISALAAVIWGVWGVRWLRWLGLITAVINLVLIPAVILMVIIGRAILTRLLPESWEVYSPTFSLTARPIITVAGAALIVLSLIGRTPTRGQHSVQQAVPTVLPPPAPQWAPPSSG